MNKPKSTNSTNTLKKRVKRFLYNTPSIRNEVGDIISLLETRAGFDVFIFGGMLRDINLFTVREFYSDIDFVSDCSLSELISFLSTLPNEYNIQRNKFGGFRIKRKRWVFDIWCLEDTWAFKHNLVKFRGPSSLLDTTFLSWDSILFDIKDKSIICKPNYLDELSSGYIEIVLEKTPNYLGSLVKINRAIFGKGVKEIGPKAASFLNKGFRSYDANSIINYERSKFEYRAISEKKLIDFKRFFLSTYSKDKSFVIDFNAQLEIENLDYFELSQKQNTSENPFLNLKVSLPTKKSTKHQFKQLKFKY